MLLEKMKRNELSHSDQEEIERFIQSSPIKEREYNEAKYPTERYKQLDKLMDIDIDKSLKRMQERLPAIRPSKIVRLYKSTKVRLIAAVLFIALLGGVYLILSSSNSPIRPFTYIILPDGNELNMDEAAYGLIYQKDGLKISKDSAGLLIDTIKGYSNEMDQKEYVIVTGRRKNEQVKLQDGSLVKLNATTSLKVPVHFTAKERRVHLEGEGLFAVQSNEQLPFFVSTLNNLEVMAVGTLFNVNSYDKQHVKTTLIHGKVKVIKEKDTCVLTKGLVEAQPDKKLITKKEISTGDEVAWAENDFLFTNKNIFEVMKTIGRWYDFDVEYVGTMPTLTITGKFSRELTLEQVIKTLQNHFDITIKPLGKKLIVSPNTN